MYQQKVIEIHWVYNKDSDIFIPSTNACMYVYVHVCISLC